MRLSPNHRYLIPNSAPNTHPTGVGLPSLDVTYKWNHIPEGPLCLTSFTYHDVARLIDVAGISPVRDRIIFQYRNTSHFILVFLWVNSTLATMNNAATALTLRFLFEYIFSILLDIYADVELLGYMSSCFLMMVLICISLITATVEHLLMYLPAICISYLEDCLFKFFAHF